MAVTEAAFNRIAPSCAGPIATAAVGHRLAGIAVRLQGTAMSTTGVVLCSEIGALDLRSRNGRRVEQGRGFITDLLPDCLRDVIERARP